MTYLSVSVIMANTLITWAQENGVEWDARNADELKSDEDLVDLGMEIWPEEQKFNENI